MRLSKEVCSRCCDAADRLRGSVYNPLFAWTPERDDKAWDSGFVCCAYSRDNDASPSVWVDGGVPEWCPYASEHAVSE